MTADQVEDWLKIGEVGLIASVKFLFAPFEAERQGFNFGESFTITTIGGVIGILVFYYAGANISTWWRHTLAVIKAIFTKKSLYYYMHKQPRRFTRTRRF